MNAALATSNSPQDPATGAAPEPITAAQRAREQVEQALDTPHPFASAQVLHGDAIADALPKPAADSAEIPMAVVVLVITHDRISQFAHLHMGGLHAVHRNWLRTARNTWGSRDPEFIAAEDRIGVELAEFSDSLDFPSRIADMLPRLPTQPASEAKANAAAFVEELRHG